MSGTYSAARFEKSTIHYIGGRFVNGIAAFAVFVWIAHELPLQEYAKYVAAFALLEIGLVFSSLGIEWVTAVYLPQFRLKASGRVIGHFVWCCVIVQGISYALGSSLLYLLAPRLAGWIALDSGASVIRLYALVMCIEGLSRFFREQLLTCFMLQSAAQVSQLSRQLGLLLLVILLFENQEWRTAEGLALLEVYASAISLVLAAAFLSGHLYAIRTDPSTDAAWRCVSWRKLANAGLDAWFSNLASLCWSGQLIVLLVTRLAGGEVAALFGFSRNLAEQVRKYMPMEFLFGIARVLVIARFSAEQDRCKLGLRIGMMYKANLLFLLPILAMAVVHGESVCAFLSGGRYSDAHWFLVGWVALLLAIAHRRLTDLLAHTVGQSNLTRQASIPLVLTPFAAVAVIQSSAWSLLFIILLVVEAAYTVYVLVRVNHFAPTYFPHWAGLAKCTIAALIASIAISGISVSSDVASLISTTVVACGVTWGFMCILKMWSSAEKSLLPAGLLQAGRRWIRV